MGLSEPAGAAAPQHPGQQCAQPAGPALSRPGGGEAEGIEGTPTPDAQAPGPAACFPGSDDEALGDSSGSGSMGIRRHAGPSKAYAWQDPVQAVPPMCCDLAGSGTKHHHHALVKQQHAAGAALGLLGHPQYGPAGQLTPAGNATGGGSPTGGFTAAAPLQPHLLLGGGELGRMEDMVGLRHQPHGGRGGSGSGSTGKPGSCDQSPARGGAGLMCDAQGGGSAAAAAAAAAALHLRTSAGGAAKQAAAMALRDQNPRAVPWSAGGGLSVVPVVAAGGGLGARVAQAGLQQQQQQELDGMRQTGVQAAAHTPSLQATRPQPLALPCDDLLDVGPLRHKQPASPSVPSAHAQQQHQHSQQLLQHQQVLRAAGAHISSPVGRTARQLPASLPGRPAALGSAKHAPAPTSGVAVAATPWLQPPPPPPPPPPRRQVVMLPSQDIRKAPGTLVGAALGSSTSTRTYGGATGSGSGRSAANAGLNAPAGGGAPAATAGPRPGQPAGQPLHHHQGYMQQQQQQQPAAPPLPGSVFQPGVDAPMPRRPHAGPLSPATQQRLGEFGGAASAGVDGATASGQRSALGAASSARGSGGVAHSSAAGMGRPLGSVRQAAGVSGPGRGWSMSAGAPAAAPAGPEDLGACAAAGRAGGSGGCAAAPAAAVGGGRAGQRQNCSDKTGTDQPPSPPPGRRGQPAGGAGGGSAGGEAGGPAARASPVVIASCLPEDEDDLLGITPNSGTASARATPPLPAAQQAACAVPAGGAGGQRGVVPHPPHHYQPALLPLAPPPPPPPRKARRGSEVGGVCGPAEELGSRARALSSGAEPQGSKHAPDGMHQAWPHFTGAALSGGSHGHMGMSALHPPLGQQHHHHHMAPLVGGSAALRHHAAPLSPGAGMGLPSPQLGGYASGPGGGVVRPPPSKRLEIVDPRRKSCPQLSAASEQGEEGKAQEQQDRPSSRGSSSSDTPAGSPSDLQGA